MSNVVMFRDKKWTTAHINMSGAQAAVRLDIKGTAKGKTSSVVRAAIAVNGSEPVIVPMLERTGTDDQPYYACDVNVGGQDVTLFANGFKGKHGWFYRVRGTAVADISDKVEF